MHKPPPNPWRRFVWLLAFFPLMGGCATPRANGEASPPEDRTNAATRRADDVRLEPVPEIEVGERETAVRQQLTAARNDVQQLLAQTPHDSAALGEAFGHLGMVLNAYQFLDAATVAYRNAAVVEPTDSRWPYYRAFILQLQGHLEDATTLYQRVLELEPGDVTTHLRIADALFEANASAAARHHFERALDLRPDSAAAHSVSAAAHFGLGRIAAGQGRQAAAITHFEQAIAAQPEATEVHYPLAMALRQSGDLERAEAHLGLQGQTQISIPDRRLAGITRLGRGLGYHRMRGEVALAEERCEPAVASFELALAEAPGDRDARAGLAAALRQCGDFEDAISQLLLSYLAGPEESAPSTAHPADAGSVEGQTLDSEPPTRLDFEVPPRPVVERLETPVRRRLSSLHDAAQTALDANHNDHAATRFGQLAQLYLAYGLDDAARSHFVAARQLQPGEPSWGYFLAVLAQTRDPQRAREELRKFLDRRPAAPAAWTRLGQIELELGKVNDAEKAFRQALTLDENNAAACFGLGRTTLARDQPEAAVVWLERALAQQPDAGRVHHVLGQAFRQLGQIDRARSHLAQADDHEVRLDDPLIDRLGDVLTLTAFEVVLAMANNPEVTLEDHLGYALSKLGDVQGAAERLTDALRLSLDASPADVRARLHYVAGGLWVRRTVDARAEEHFLAALELDPKLLDAGVKLGNIAARQGDWQTAITAYNAVLDSRHDHHPALRKRAAAHAALGNLTKATRDLRRLVTLAPDDTQSRIQLARALEQAGDGDAGYDLLRDVARLPAAETAAMLTARGDMDQRRGAFEVAIEHYRQALEHAPSASRSRLQLAATLGHLGRLDEALSHYAHLLLLEPDHVDGHLGRTTCLVLLERHGEARQQLEEGLRATPGNLELSHFLARLLASAPSSEVRDGERAVALALAVYRRHASPDAAETVAMAFAEAGRFTDAQIWQRRLLDDANRRRDNGLISRLQPQLAAYEAEEAWRAASPDQLIVLPSTG